MSQTFSSCPPVPVDNPVLVSLTSSIISNHLLGWNQAVAEHIKMTPQEAKQKAEAIRKIILDICHQEVKPGYRNERAGWPLEYCGRIAVQMIGNFYDAVYRRHA